MVDFTPKGSDGAQTYDGSPSSQVGPRNMNLATTAFREMVMATDSANYDAARSAWNHFADSLEGDVNPQGMFVTVGVMFNAWLMRVAAGDPDPNGKPGDTIALMGVSVDRSTGDEVDTPELEQFVLRAIAYAANWQWDKLTMLFNDRLEQPDGAEFLHEMAVSLVAIFIGVGGIDAAGWRK